MADRGRSDSCRYNPHPHPRHRNQVYLLGFSWVSSGSRQGEIVVTLLYLNIDAVRWELFFRVLSS